MTTLITSIVFVCALYTMVIWFAHKASVRFHKMDKKVGNINKAEKNILPKAA